MKKISFTLLMVLLLSLILITACTAQTNTVPSTATNIPLENTPTAEMFTDPFAYCSAVGTVDSPDSRYTGEQVPDAIIDGYKEAAGLEESTEPMDMFKQTTIWRCMDSKVYACNFGANLPCDSKANTTDTATQAMTDYCTANPDSEFIPMSETGHDTIYSWHCVKDIPDVLDQIDTADAAGYLSSIWYAIEQKP